MQIWISDWVIPEGVYDVYVGGQQPNQTTTVPSNILNGYYTITE